MKIMKNLIIVLSVIAVATIIAGCASQQTSADNSKVRTAETLEQSQPDMPKTAGWTINPAGEATP